MNDPIEKHRKRIYFPGLYTFKVVSVLLILVSSVELLKAYLGLPHLYTFHTIYNAGNLGMTWAFAISGFLVTMMLLEEKNRTNQIRYRSFYARRLLRIAPVYLLVTLLAFLVLPHIGFFEISGLSSEVGESTFIKLMCYLIGQPQIAYVAYIQIPYVELLWFIGPAVLFYLIIPKIIDALDSSFWVILSVVLGVIVLREAAYILTLSVADESLSNIFKQAEQVLLYTRIECLAIGALGAILVFGEPSNLGKMLVNPIAEVIAVCATLFFVIFGYSSHVVNHDVQAAVLTILILNVSSKGESMARVENAVSRTLGKMAFAAFGVHQIAIVIAIKAMQELADSKFDSLLSNAALYLFSIALTFALAWPLHHFLEKPFLKRRARHTIVKNKGF